MAHRNSLLYGVNSVLFLCGGDPIFIVSPQNYHKMLTKISSRVVGTQAISHKSRPYYQESL